MIRTFVINMKDSKDRWDSIKTQLENLGIEHERIEGTNTKLMSEDEIDEIYDKNLALKIHPPKGLMSGHIGCAHSHLKIYKKIVEEHIPLSLIFEDDVIISEDVKKLYDDLDRKILNGNKEKWDYLSMNYGYFGLNYLLKFIKEISDKYFKKGKIGLFLLWFIGGVVYTIMDFFPRIISKITGKLLIIKRYRPFYLAGGYFITYEGARKLLNINPKIFTLADYLPEKYRKNSKLKFYIVVPLLVQQDTGSFKSIIDGKFKG